MPGWHEATRELQEAGKVQMVGIIQEQHPDRTRLFMQWKRMGWPILVDAFNLLGVSVVPLTFLIDERGIIRRVSPRLSEAGNLERDFLDRPYQPATGGARRSRAMAPDLRALEAEAAAGQAEAVRAYADALAIWGGVDRIDDAIGAYQRALRTQPADGPTLFRLGVLYRRRFESGDRQSGDFRRAVRHWEMALQVDPNNYIWRRRIQQYGPRLEKPYPFYDWVQTARQEIAARGETPWPLPVEPGGAELAAPTKSFASTSLGEEPDPGGRIYRDEGQLIEVETAVVPGRIEPGGSARVHVVFSPNTEAKAHWNNEVGDLVLWVGAPEGWRVDRRYLTVPNPLEAVSQERRKVEFEVMSTKTAASGKFTLPSYALYYVCEDVNGACLYRRQDVVIELEVGTSESPPKHSAISP